MAPPAAMRATRARAPRPIASGYADSLTGSEPRRTLVGLRRANDERCADSVWRRRILVSAGTPERNPTRNRAHHSGDERLGPDVGTAALAFVVFAKGAGCAGRRRGCRARSPGPSDAARPPANTRSGVRGGSDEESNVLSACHSCNQSRGALLVNEFTAILRRRYPAIGRCFLRRDRARQRLRQSFRSPPGQRRVTEPRRRSHEPHCRFHVGHHAERETGRPAAGTSPRGPSRAFRGLRRPRGAGALPAGPCGRECRDAAAHGKRG